MNCKFESRGTSTKSTTSYENRLDTYKFLRSKARVLSSDTIEDEERKIASFLSRFLESKRLNGRVSPYKIFRKIEMSLHNGKHIRFVENNVIKEFIAPYRDRQVQADMYLLSRVHNITWVYLAAYTRVFIMKRMRFSQVLTDSINYPAVEKKITSWSISKA